MTLLQLALSLAAILEAAVGEIGVGAIREGEQERGGPSAPLWAPLKMKPRGGGSVHYQFLAAVVGRARLERAILIP